MSWLELALNFLGGIFGMYTVRSTLRRHGYSRYAARKKPPLSPEAKRRRKEWAEAHANWTIDQWSQILWTDETWVTGGRHRKSYVTRRADEAHHEDCVIEKHQRKNGWMFWGCFSGLTGKGPGMVWEKDWGTITSESYRAYTVPLIDGWIQLCRLQSQGRWNLVLMQDGAKAHSCYDTREDLRERGVIVIDWPPYSPDLNPIEAVWNKMKDYIEENYWEDQNPSYDRLRRYIKEAWDSITEDYLRELLATMPQRCQDVIAADGGPTKW